MATATEKKLRRINVVLRAKSKEARVPLIIVSVFAKTHEEAMEKAKSVLKSPTRWTA